MEGQPVSEQPWLIDIYDEYVASQPLGASVEESREAVSRAYAEAVESGSMPRWEEDLETEGRNLFDRLVKPVREQRKSAMVKRFEWILDAIMDGTLMEEWDPILSRAYPLGDGRDKTLRLWSVEDLENAATERFRNAAAVKTAAEEFYRRIKDIADLMRARNVLKIDDLRPPQSDTTTAA